MACAMQSCAACTASGPRFHEITLPVALVCSCHLWHKSNDYCHCHCIQLDNELRSLCFLFFPSKISWPHLAISACPRALSLPRNSGMPPYSVLSPERMIDISLLIAAHFVSVMVHVPSLPFGSPSWTDVRLTCHHDTAFIMHVILHKVLPIMLPAGHAQRRILFVGALSLIHNETTIHDPLRVRNWGRQIYCILLIHLHSVTCLKTYHLTGFKSPWTSISISTLILHVRS